MATLKEQLSAKGSKCNLQFSTREREYYEQECGFTDEELTVLGCEVEISVWCALLHI